MIRQEAGMPVSRFCMLLGIPRRTYCRKLNRLRSGSIPVKGPWPSPSLDGMEPLVEQYTRAYPDYGHRRIHALLVADGCKASESTVLRAMRRLHRASARFPAKSGAP